MGVVSKQKVHTPPTSGSREPQLVIGFRGSRQPLSRDSPFYTFMEFPQHLKNRALVTSFTTQSPHTLNPHSDANHICIKIYTGTDEIRHEHKPTVCLFQQLQLFPRRYHTPLGKTTTPEPNQGAITTAP